MKARSQFRQFRLLTKAGDLRPFRIGFSSDLSAKRTAPTFTSFVLLLRSRFRLAFPSPHSVSFVSVKMPARNPTGFDINQFKAAASPSSVYAKRDPWARKYVEYPI